MSNKAILKNSGVYEVLKVAKGVNLGTLSTKKRCEKKRGISITEENCAKWFKTKNGNVIFKTYDTAGRFFELKNIRNANEVLCFELAKQIGVETAIYEPAHLNNKNGVITYNVCKKGEEVVSVIDFFNNNPKYSIQSIIKGLSLRKMNFDKLKMRLDLYKMMVFDSLTFQEDRHNNNIHFIIEKDKNTIKLSPLIDNEFAFGIKTMEGYYDSWSYAPIYKEKFLSSHGYYINFFVELSDTQIENSQKYKNNVKKLIMMAIGNEDCKVFLQNALKNLDIYAAIDKLENIGYEFSPDYKNYLIDIVEVAKRTYSQCLKELVKKEKVEMNFMINKIILKNKKKYKLLKLAKGLNLKYVKKTKRYGFSDGISTTGYSDKWFNTKYGRGIFKHYGYYNYKDIMDLRIASELLYNQVAKQVGVKVADYEPANIDGKVGLVSIDVTKASGEVVIDLGEMYPNFAINNFEVFMNALSLNQSGYNFNKDQIVFDIFKMMVLDALTFQEDRHCSNIHFILNPKTQTIKFAPIIDNEFAFGTKTINKTRELEIDETRYTDFLRRHSQYILFPVCDRTIYKNAEIKYKDDISDLLQMCYSRPEYENFVIKCLKNIDINKAIAEIENKGYKFSADYKKYLNDLIKLSKQIFVSKIKVMHSTHPSFFSKGDELSL